MTTSMSTKIAFAFLLIGNITAFGQKLYPVQGPLASESAPPTFSGQIRHPIVGGVLPTLLKSWTLANGEIASGKCASTKPASINTKTPGSPDSYPPQPNLAFAWDSVYGEGYFAGHILGEKMWQGIFRGNQGTVLQVEILDEKHGVAADNKGNTYKVVW